MKNTKLRSLMRSLKKKLSFSRNALFKKVLFTFFLFFIFISERQGYCEDLKEVLKQVEIEIQKGNQTTSFEERRLAYNDAIFLLNSVKEKDPSPAIDYVLGNVYDDLGEYPLALFSYYCALKKGVINDDIEKRIERINGILEINTDPFQKAFNFFDYFSLIPYLGLESILYLFITIFLLTLVLLSIDIWVPGFISKNCIFLFIIFCVYITSVLIVRTYFDPIEAIVVHSTRMYSKESDLEQTQLRTSPLIAGNKVTIIKLSSDKKWVKIKSSQGLIGYVSLLDIQTICNE